DGTLTGGGDEVLDEHAVLQHADLRGALAVADPLAHHHGALDRFAPGQELGLGQDRCSAAARFPAVPPALPLGLQPGRPAHAAHLVVVRAGRLLVGGGVGASGGFPVVRAAPAAPPAPTARAAFDLGAVGLGSFPLVRCRGLVGTLGFGVVTTVRRRTAIGRLVTCLVLAAVLGRGLRAGLALPVRLRLAIRRAGFGSRLLLLGRL